MHPVPWGAMEICIIYYAITITKPPQVRSIFLTEDTQIMTYAWEGEWGLTLIGAYKSPWYRVCSYVRPTEG